MSIYEGDGLSKGDQCSKAVSGMAEEMDGWNDGYKCSKPMLGDI